MPPQTGDERRIQRRARQVTRWSALVVSAGLMAACQQPSGATSVAHRASDLVPVPATRAPAQGSPAWAYARGDYQRSGEIVVTAGTAGDRQVVAPLGSFNSALDTTDVQPTSGAILFGDEPGEGLWLSHLGAAPMAIDCPGDHGGPADAFPLRISPDGRTVAYGHLGSASSTTDAEVRLVGIDGCRDRLLVNDHRRFVDAPLYLVPLGWSADSQRLILVPTAEVDALSHGLFVADVHTGAVTPVAGTKVGMSQVALSPDGTRAAYTTLERPVDEQQGPLPIPPNRIEVVDLATGAVTVIAQEAADTVYGDPLWSPDGRRLGYTVYPYSQPRAVTVKAADLAAGTTATLATDDPASRPGLVPHLWLPGDRVVYTAATPGTDDVEVLWVQDLASGTWTEVDRAPQLAVLGWYQ
jgi:hypothetical protein